MKCLLQCGNIMTKLWLSLDTKILLSGLNYLCCKGYDDLVGMRRNHKYASKKPNNFWKEMANELWSSVLTQFISLTTARGLCHLNMNRCRSGAHAEVTHQSANHLSAKRSFLRTQPQTLPLCAASLMPHTHIRACLHTLDCPPSPKLAQTHADTTDVDSHHTCTHRRGGLCCR